MPTTISLHSYFFYVLLRNSLSLAKDKNSGSNVNSTSWSKSKKPTGVVKTTWPAPTHPPVYRAKCAMQTPTTRFPRWKGNARANRIAS